MVVVDARERDDKRAATGVSWAARCPNKRKTSTINSLGVLAAITAVHRGLQPSVVYDVKLL